VLVRVGTDLTASAVTRGAWLSEAFRVGTTAAAVAEHFAPELLASFGAEPTAAWFVDGVDRSGWSEMAVSAAATEAVDDGGFVVRVLADREWRLPKARTICRCRSSLGITRCAVAIGGPR
jgi:hypothetical protein